MLFRSNGDSEHVFLTLIQEIQYGRRYSRDEWISKLTEVANESTEQEFNYIVDAFTKDLKIGMSGKSVNEVYKKEGIKDLIFEFECMKVTSLDESYVNPEGAFVSIKYDGVNATFLDGVFYSREGKTLYAPHLEEIFEGNPTLKWLKDKYAIFGELLYSSQPSQTAGIVMSASQLFEESTRPFRELDFMVFDIVKKEEYFSKVGTTPFYERHAVMAHVFKKLKDENFFTEQNKLWIPLHRRAFCMEDIYKMYDEARANGEEGIIINDQYAVHELKRSKLRARIKAIIDTDLEIIGFTPHKERADWIGAIEVASKCRTVTSLVGTGLTELDREEMYRKSKELIGRIIAVRYNAITEDKKSKTKSLRHPVFNGLRFDKSEADIFNF